MLTVILWCNRRSNIAVAMTRSPKDVPPAGDELLVQAPDLLVQQATQRQAVCPDRGGDWGRGSASNSRRPPDGRPALNRGWLEVPPGQECQQPVRDPGPL